MEFPFYAGIFKFRSARFLLYRKHKLNRAYSLGAGWIYITNCTLPNPYGELPPYFSELCEYLRNMK